MVLSNARDCIGLEVNSLSSSPRPEVRLPTSRASHSSHRCSIVSSPDSSTIHPPGFIHHCLPPPQHRVVSGPEPHQHDLSSLVSSSSSAPQATSIDLLEPVVRQLGAPPRPSPGDSHPGCQVDSDSLLRQLAPPPCHLVSSLISGKSTVAGDPRKSDLLAVDIEVP